MQARQQKLAALLSSQLPQHQFIQQIRNHLPIYQERRTSSSSVGSLLPLVLLLLFFLCSVFSTADALTCYETENGKTFIKHNDEWLYCSLVPYVDYKEKHLNGTRFGVGPENDVVKAYKSAFVKNDEHYEVLTVCIFERYDFSRFLNLKPSTAVEFAFRCMCNYNLCNSEETFYSYMKALKQESYTGHN